MLFKSKYRITDKILNNISQITADREVIERSKLIPKWRLKLVREARLRNAHSSTSIEGNRLTLAQVKALSEKKDVTASSKDKKEVVNYLQALDSIPKYAKEKKYTVKTFLDIHNKVTRGTLRAFGDSGAFRKLQVFVGKKVFDGTGFKEVVEYQPPEAKEVPLLVNCFLEWLNSNNIEEINPVILAGIVHYEVARIHPFIDGNGRTARLFASLALYRSGFDHRRFFALDDYYDEDRNSYYEALKTVDRSKGDLTQWLEYFTEGVLSSVNKVKEIVLKFSFAPGKKEIGQIELTDRQMKILEEIKEKGKVTNGGLRDIFKISRQATLKEILKLIELEIIEPVGKGRGAYYRMKG